jgi:hypothetical protein
LKILKRVNAGKCPVFKVVGRERERENEVRKKNGKEQTLFRMLYKHID